MKPATLWSRLLKNNEGVEYWDYNHLEDGHCENAVPTPKHDIHKSVWKGGKWSATLVQLDDQNVVRNYTIEDES